MISLGASPPQVYRKTHLVPFGEFIPLRPVLGWIVSVLAIPLQDFTRGAPDQQPLDVAGQRVAVNICYEDVFGEEIIRQLPRSDAARQREQRRVVRRLDRAAQHLQISQAARARDRALHAARDQHRHDRGDRSRRPRACRPPAAVQTAARSTVDGAGLRSGATPYVRWGNYAVIALCCRCALLALLHSSRSALVERR